jgi:hypothetical protein
VTILVLLLLSLETPVDDLRPRVEAQPEAVRDFIERRAMCNHWLGEEPYDVDRTREIEQAIAELRCAEIEAEEAVLRFRYSARPDTLALLDETRDILAW